MKNVILIIFSPFLLISLIAVLTELGVEKSFDQEGALFCGCVILLMIFSSHIEEEETTKD